ncbi:hypothetical protein BD311DRAFT_656173 [Dichomitus squalens]|uniref:HIT-type domain-containing protein n=1 Tax=Dichomitus squalens TaxID=114155 RepID=A0A4Q9QCI7_9APHY|nr:hypothetical protein BD311DRAFT_656173 [Dichomitus squalens]TBU64414.1 hypothetical protein BD310DRAFT_806530 [Dichomitus squalens]
MAPPKRAQCQVCESTESKYTCAKCSVVYCSVPCYKQHKVPSTSDTDVSIGDAGPPLRSLASLKWPYVPEESAYPDPLKRDDPKPLQLPQYEAIATSPAIRRILGSNPRLRETLISIDKLRGEDREMALEEALGIGGSRNNALTSLGTATEEDRKVLRELAEAVEGAVRGGKQDMLGLDWGD